VSDGRPARQWRQLHPRWVAGAFLISGTTHLVKPSVFHPMMPRYLPRHRELIYASGVAELACAGGLLAKNRWAGPASAALLLAVWPANLQMALDATARARRRGYRPAEVATAAAVWARMPLQIPLIRAALNAR
jgi:uncharacterized membrane protein